jgi:hypothetical protein
MDVQRKPAEMGRPAKAEHHSSFDTAGREDCVSRSGGRDESVRRAA